MSDSTKESTEMMEKIMGNLLDKITKIIDKKFQQSQTLSRGWQTTNTQEEVYGSIPQVVGEEIHKPLIDLSVDRASSIGENRFLNHQELNAMEKALKLIIGSAEFRPQTEEELDDKFQVWSTQLLRSGFSKKVIMNVLYNTLTESYKNRLPHDILHGADYIRFWDTCAITLFPLSRQITKVLSRLMGEKERCLTLKKAMVEFEKDKLRYYILLRRYPQDLPILSDRRWIENLGKRLPLNIYRQAQLLMQTPGISLQQIEDQLRSLETEEAEEKIMVNPIVIKDIKDSSGQINQVKQYLPHPDGPLCYSCGKRGHKSPWCEESRKKCQNCGRSGHKSDFCKTMQLERRYGPDLRIAAQGTRAGIKLTAHQDQNHESYLRIQANEAKRQADKLAMIKDRAKERHKEYRDIEKAYWDNRPEEALAYAKGKSNDENKINVAKNNKQQEMVDISDEAEIEMANPALIANTNIKDHRTRPPAPLKRFINIDIESCIIEVLVDTGAQVSVLKESVIKRLPPDAQANFKRTIESIDGVGGRIESLGQIELMVRIGNNAVMENFWVIEDDKVPINLIGDTLLRSIEGIINCGTDTLQLGQEVLPLTSKGSINSLIKDVEAYQVEKEPEITINKALKDEEKQQIKDLIYEFQACWKDPKLGQCHILPFEIDTGDSEPRAVPLRPVSLVKQEIIQKTVEELLVAGAIKPSKSPWCSATVVVKKKNGESRVCIDYRLLNKITKRDVFPLPRIDMLLSRLGNAKYFSNMDLFKGYHQIIIEEKDREKTAFITNNGLYEYTVLPFGLANAPPFFQRVMQEVLKELLWKNVLVYLDDIVVFTSDWKEHLIVLKEVFKRLSEAKLYLNIKKSAFGMETITYLGYIITDGTIYPDPNKLAPLKLCPTPNNVAELRSFLGLAGYFRRFIDNYATKTQILYQLLRKDQDWIWDETRTIIFNKLETDLCDTPILLHLPQWDYPFILNTDASGIAIAAVLQQDIGNGGPQVISYASRALTDNEIKWSTRELEAYAIVWGIYHFEQYLDNRKFIVRTDHESLKWLWSATGPPRVARWALALQYFDFKIIYRSGKKQTHVDYFSRNLPILDTEDKLTDKIAMKPSVFQLLIDDQDENAPPKKKLKFLPKPVQNLDNYTRLDWPFPTPEEFMKAQKEEDEQGISPSLIKTDGKLSLSPLGKIYVPKKLRDALMYHFHFSRIGQHAGINRMYRTIVKRFWWPYLKESLQEYVSNCLTCLRARIPKRSVGEGVHLASEPMVLVAVDLFDCEMNGRHYKLLTMMDYATRFPIVRICNGTTASLIWKEIYLGWVSLLGSPIYLLTDNGPPFSSAEFERKLKEFNIIKIKSTVYYPQGNAIIESFHQYLRRGINIQARINPDLQPEEIISTLLYHYRATPTIATGESPFYLLTGIEMLQPGLQMYAMIPDLSRKLQLELLILLRHDLMEQTMRCLAIKERKIDEEVKVGDLIIYELSAAELQNFNKVYVKGKALPKWSEPMRVIGVESNGQRLVVRSIWEQGKIKEVSRRQVQLIKNLDDEDIIPWTEIEINQSKRQEIGTWPLPEHLQRIADDFESDEN